MLTFNVILGYQGLLFRDFVWFFFSIQLTDPISGNAFDAKRKKRGWPYISYLHTAKTKSLYFTKRELMLPHWRKTIVSLETNRIILTSPSTYPPSPQKKIGERAPSPIFSGMRVTGGGSCTQARVARCPSSNLFDFRSKLLPVLLFCCLLVGGQWLCGKDPCCLFRKIICKSNSQWSSTGP